MGFTTIHRMVAIRRGRFITAREESLQYGSIRAANTTPALTSPQATTSYQSAGIRRSEYDSGAYVTADYNVRIRAPADSGA